MAVCAPSVGASEIASRDGGFVWAGVGGTSGQDRQDEAGYAPPLRARVALAAVASPVGYGNCGRSRGSVYRPANVCAEEIYCRID